MEEKNPTVAFGVACSFDIPDEDMDEDDMLPPIFFVTFQTKDEEKAIKLAQCFCGTREKAKASLLVLDKDGRIW